MEQQNNAVATVTEQNKVTKELCIQFLKSQHTDLTQGEFEMFAAVAIAFNLNPYLKEIYPIKYSGKMNLITGYQTYIKRAETFPQFDGYDTLFEGEGKNLCCVCNVYRKDRSRPTTARVYFSEYTQNNTMWNTKPHVMLEKVAIGTAFRRAFPTDMGGMPYTTEEIRAEDELKAQGYTEVQQAAPMAHVEPPKAAKTQDDFDDLDNRNEGATTEKPKDPAKTQASQATKPKAEPAPQATPTAPSGDNSKAFFDAMKALAKKNYEMYLDLLGKEGFERASDIPEEKRTQVYLVLYHAINKEA